MSPLRRFRRLSVAAAATLAVLVFTGCAGEPSPLMKAIAGAGSGSAGGPVVSAIEPTSGSVSGGTLTITGTDLQKISVRVGDQKATVTQAGAEKVVATVPAAKSFTAGAVPIVVTGTDGGSVDTHGARFDYQVQTPVDKQLAYAMTYWKNYNTAEYGDLNPVGGDCANFVSQTLLARGWQMNSEWYNHDAAADWSPAWGYVPSMDQYFQDNAAQLGLTEYSFDQRDRIKVGDIVMFDWNDNDSLDHVQIVSGIEKVNGTIKIAMVGHNEDTDYRDLDNAITVEHPGAIGHFWALAS